MGFGSKLNDLLQAKNMTVMELSKLTGISHSTLYAIIRRDSDNVNLSAIQKIASVLQVSVDSLMQAPSDFKIGDIFNTFTGDFIDTDNDIIDVHFSSDEFTVDEIAEIVQFADFLKQRRNSNLP